MTQKIHWKPQGIGQLQTVVHDSNKKKEKKKKRYFSESIACRIFLLSTEMVLTLIFFMSHLEG